MEVFSFFSGVGFLDLGFQDAGFNIVFVDENNETFLEAYQYARRNTDFSPKYGYSSNDIRDFLINKKWESLFIGQEREAGLVGFIGGPPCPDFSVAGKNEGETGRNGQLTDVYVKLILKRKPDFFLLENVKGLYKTQKHRVFYEKLIGKLRKGGYSVFDTISNALEYGAPQSRERLFVVGFKRSTFGKDISFQFGTKRFHRMNEIDAIAWPTTSPFVENGYLEMPDGIIESLTVENWFARNNVENHPNQIDVFKTKNVQKYLTIPEGDSKGKSFKRLHRWRYSPTAAYGNNEVHLHPYLPRRISVAEALAIQSAPPWFSLPNSLSLSAKFKMVGNGVPYCLAYGIAKEIKYWLDQHEVQNGNN